MQRIENQGNDLNKKKNHDPTGTKKGDGKEARR
jgi:hypothetical protein